MTLAQAREMSWEELELMAAAHKRKTARDILKLAQLVIAGQGDSRAWQKKQKEIIAEANG